MNHIRQTVNFMGNLLFWHTHTDVEDTIINNDVIMSPDGDVDWLTWGHYRGLGFKGARYWEI